jgi:hypothetical protein
MPSRSVRFRILATVLTALALSSLGCMKKAEQAPGVLVGSYAITGTLIENSCGSGLSTKNPLTFSAAIRDSDGVINWQVAKGAASTGVLRADGQYRFVTEQATSLGPQVMPKTNLQPSDFFTNQADFDLKKTNCTLLTKESIFGTLHRMLSIDGGVVQEDAGVGADLSGDNTIEVTVAAGADCSAVLAANGGSYLTLPCEAHYSLEGSLDTSSSTSN